MNPEFWNRRYSGEALHWGADPNRFLTAEVSGMAPGRCLDLAAGEGRNAVWLATGGWEVRAVDFSFVGLEKGRRLADARGVSVEWELADLREYVPTSRAYDLVIVFYLHLPWPEVEPILRCAADAVISGGTFLLVGHDRTNLESGYGGPPNPAVLYTATEVAGVLSDLQIEKATAVRRPIDTEEGTREAIDCLVRATRATSA